MSATPRNVPLSRFGQFVHELFQSADEACEVIFICRSGSRSAKAAEVLRRLGFASSWHVAGGIALSGSKSRIAN
ncbi:MAG: rhodanese-like domain-containing protein, partial [Planctomycetota bacterium]